MFKRLRRFLGEQSWRCQGWGGEVDSCLISPEDMWTLSVHHTPALPIDLIKCGLMNQRVYWLLTGARLIERPTSWISPTCRQLLKSPPALCVAYIISGWDFQNLQKGMHQWRLSAFGFLPCKPCLSQVPPYLFWGNKESDQALVRVHPRTEC